MVYRPQVTRVIKTGWFICNTAHFGPHSILRVGIILHSSDSVYQFGMAVCLCCKFHTFAPAGRFVLPCFTHSYYAANAILAYRLRSTSSPFLTFASYPMKTPTGPRSLLSGTLTDPLYIPDRRSPRGGTSAPGEICRNFPPIGLYPFSFTSENPHPAN